MSIAMAKIFPYLAILAAVMLSAVPWGLPGGTAFVPPLIVLSLVFLFAADPEEGAPAWFAFLAGLLTDILTAGPLGYWALLFLMTHVLARMAVAPFARRPVLVLVGFAMVASLVMAIGWGLASAYYMRVLDFAPMAMAVFAATALFPALQWLTRGRRGARDRREGAP